MVEKTWPALQSCKHQCNQANDRLNKLPDDILFFIMSFLTMKEAARTSVLSHRWNYLSRCFPVLIFEDSSMRKWTLEDIKIIHKKRLRFLMWVNQVVEAHHGKCVDKLRVAFDLDKSCQSDMDKWLIFALSKQVKSLELDFTSPFPNLHKPKLPRWRVSLDQPHNVSFFYSCLHSLCLRDINVTTKDIDCLLRSCTVLENLCIHSSRPLRHIRAFSLPLSLKRLDISHCLHLKTIDILAPKLLSFTHYGFPIELKIRNASMLLNLSVGNKCCREDMLAYAFDPLSKYFPQLEYLCWKVQLYHGAIRFADCFQVNLGINNPPAMTNLKHLELHVSAFCEQSLLGWADLIEASPVLERLTVKFLNFDGDPRRKIMKRSGRPLKSLKTLELYNDLGLPIDLEFASYIFENSMMLKDVIVEVRPLSEPLSGCVSVKDQVTSLKKMVPQGVNFTLNMVEEWTEIEPFEWFD